MRKLWNRNSVEQYQIQQGQQQQQVCHQRHHETPQGNQQQQSLQNFQYIQSQIPQVHSQSGYIQQGSTLQSLQTGKQDNGEVDFSSHGVNINNLDLLPAQITHSQQNRSNKSQQHSEDIHHSDSYIQSKRNQRLITEQGSLGSNQRRKLDYIQFQDGLSQDTLGSEIYKEFSSSQLQSEIQSSYYQGLHKSQEQDGQSQIYPSDNKDGQAQSSLFQQSVVIEQVLNGQSGLSNSQNFKQVTLQHLYYIIQNVPQSTSIIPILQNTLYHIDSPTVVAILKILIDGDLQDRAIEVFDWLRNLPLSDPRSKLCDVECFNVMIYQCNTVFQLQRALELVVDMRSRSLKCNVDTYTNLLQVCLRGKQYRLAIDVYDQMDTEKVEPNAITYSLVVKVYIKLSQWNKAMETIITMQVKGLDPDIRIYNQLIGALCKVRLLDEAHSVYITMLHSNIKPSTLTFTLLINIFGKKGDLEKCLTIYNEMRRLGVERNAVLYSCLINSCEKANQWQMALEIFSQMKQDNVEANVVIYNSLITAYAQGNMWQKAWKTFDEMQLNNIQPDQVSYTAIVLALQKGKQWRLILQVWNKAQLQNIETGKIMLNLLIDSLWASGVVSAQWRAFQLLSQSQLYFMFQKSVLDKEILYKAQIISNYSAILMIYKWLIDIRQLQQQQVEFEMNDFSIIFIGTFRRNRLSYTLNGLYFELKTILKQFHLPFKIWLGGDTLEMKGKFSSLQSWFHVFGQILDTHLPTSSSKLQLPSDQQLVEGDRQNEEHCKKLYKQYLKHQNMWILNKNDYYEEMNTSRDQLIQILKKFQQHYNFSLDLMYATMQLVDAVIWRREIYQNYQLHKMDILAYCCLVITSKQQRFYPELANLQQIQQPFTLEDLNKETEAIEWALGHMSEAQGGVYQSVTALQVVSTYMERVNSSNLQGNSQGQLNVTQQPEHAQDLFVVIDQCACKWNLSCFPQTMIAAAAWYCVRVKHALVPFWPQTVEDLTGYTLSEGQQISQSQQNQELAECVAIIKQSFE